MQLRINIINNEIFDNIETILYSEDKQISNWFNQNLPWEIYEKLSPQYEIQVMSSMQIKKILWWNIFKNIKWFYFWTEQCEFLVPTLDETKRAIEKIKQFDKKYVSNELKRFVFLTSYYWNKTIQDRIIKNLKYLNENANFINPKYKKVEIVVNDFWLLKLLKDFNNLEPIIWRLLIKTLKNPIVDSFSLEDNLHLPWEFMKNKSEIEIKEKRTTIANNQRKWFWSSTLKNKYFLNFLEKKSIKRAWLDYQIWYKQMFEVNINIDIYYPYALIFVWRLCDTSAIENIRRWYYPIDEVCPRTCRKYDMFIKDFETVWYKLIQRWNAQYKSQIDLDLNENTLNKYENRLIYTPLI